MVRQFFLKITVDATCPGGFTLYRGLCLALSNQTMLSWPNALVRVYFITLGTFVLLRARVNVTMYGTLVLVQL